MESCEQVREGDRKLLSIIIPVYNVEKYVATCLDSVLEQDIGHDEYEIICINDGSTDGSLQILQEYAEKYNNIVVIDKPNEGVSATRNLGIEKAQGEYIWFIDADDWIARNCLGYIFDIIKKHNVSVVQLQYDYIKAEWRVQQCQTYVAEKEKLQYELLKEPQPYGICWSIVNKKLIVENKLRFFQHLPYGEDLIFIRSIFDCIKLQQKQCDEYTTAHCTGSIFYFYRQNENSAMTTRWTKNREKYAQSLLGMARIEKERMEKENMPTWYTQQYKQRFYSSMYTYMMFWLPGLEGKLKIHLKTLKEEELYPIRKIKDDSEAKSLAEKCKHFMFRHKFLYKIYYKIMQKKYKKVEKQDKE